MFDMRPVVISALPKKLETSSGQECICTYYMSAYALNIVHLARGDQYAVRSNDGAGRGGRAGDGVTRRSRVRRCRTGATDPRSAHPNSARSPDIADLAAPCLAECAGHAGPS